MLNDHSFQDYHFLRLFNKTLFSFEKRFVQTAPGAFATCYPFLPDIVE